ncbi:leucine-rich repeat and IQ domain-containing protein 1 isoform X1 [Embiotoca jacksoni]|uniref:leucine-rich repeat and IQ domain-containing protein 1 isoform X1 n=1 Tax=Embiotoca jacksoni TaxID=100190 RepID=UPI003703F4D1
MTDANEMESIMEELNHVVISDSDVTAGEQDTCSDGSDVTAEEQDTCSDGSDVTAGEQDTCSDGSDVTAGEQDTCSDGSDGTAGEQDTCSDGSDGTAGEQDTFSCHEAAASDQIPAALLSYFTASKSRAAVCEKLILEELEDGVVNLPGELNEDVMPLNEQVIFKTKKEEKKTDDGPIGRRVCPNYEGEAGADEYSENENPPTLKVSECEAEQEKQLCEEMRRRRENDFQEELRKIMEVEKLHQLELEVMERRAQEKLEQELLLQQEVISNLKKRVAQERWMIEEERRRRRKEKERKIKKEEEDEKRKEEKRRREEEEEKRRKQEDKKRKEEEEKRRKQEDEKKKKEEQEKRMKEEEKRKKEEEDKREKEEEDKRRRQEDDQTKIQEERKRSEEEEKRKIVEMRLKEKEDRRKMEEEQRMKEKMKRVEEQKNIEQMTKKEEKRKIKEMRSKEEEERRKKEEEENQKEREKSWKREDEEEMKRKDMMKMMEDKMSKNEEEIKLNNELRKTEEEERKKRDEEELRLSKELEVRMKQEEGKRGKESEKRRDEQMRREEEETRNAEDKMQLKGVEEKRKKDEDRRRSVDNKSIVRKEEEKKTEEEEPIQRQKEEEEYRNTEEEMEGDKGDEANNRKLEQQVTKYQEKDGVGEKEDETRNIEAEELHHGRKDKEENRDRERKQETEQEEKRENTSLKSQHADSTGISVTSQGEDSSTWMSSGPRPRPDASTASTSGSDTGPQQESIRQASGYQTTDQQDPAGKPSSSSSCSLPASLPEHTEHRRLSWMKDCVSWSELSLQNRRKQNGSVRSRRRAAGAGTLPPLCTHTLLQRTGCRSLTEVTTVTLEGLPGCSLSTLAQCLQLQSLTLRRCGLRSVEGFSRLAELCYVDLQENDISSVDCEDMSSLRVLRLSYNKLTSIHGLSGADNLDVLDLSHNSITRIAGLESARRLQRLSVDHNQLISTKGLRNVYTLLHLDCSHNHLVSVEGLESSALLHTLDLRGNSLTEPPGLNNQVLLRELHLDDNSISSLQGLAACWLPLMQQLSAAHNRITELPSMSDFVSLESLDVRFNCLSELQDVCDRLEGSWFLREVHLTGNPLQEERGWRSALQKALPGLRAADSQQTDSVLSPPAVQQVSSASGCFLTFCQAQLQQTGDLQQRHSRELSDASSPSDAVRDLCHHLTVTLQLAEDQRFAHEYGDTTVPDDRATPEETADTERVSDYPEMESTNKQRFTSKEDIRCSDGRCEERRSDPSDVVAVAPTTRPTVIPDDSSSTNGKTTGFNLKTSSNRQDLEHTAAVVIQQHWRKYRQKYGNINAPSIVEKGGGRGGRGGDGGEPESGSSFISRNAVGQHDAAAVIQAFWRGVTLRRRLASALAAVTHTDAGEDDTLEEVDVDEFVFDEAALEKRWTATLCEDSPPRRRPVTEVKSQNITRYSPDLPPGRSLHSSQDKLPPPLPRSPKQAWMEEQHEASAAHRVSPQSPNRGKSAASTSVLSRLSERSEKILEEWGFTDSHTALLMLRRAQKMKSKKQQKEKHRDPSVRLASFRNCSDQPGPPEAPNRPARHDRNHVKVGEAELGCQRTEQVEQEAEQRLHTRAERPSDSGRFLPEMKPSVLCGRVQLVVDPAYTDRRHHRGASWAGSRSAAPAGQKLLGSFKKRSCVS